MNLFESLDYRAILRQTVEERKKLDRRTTFQRVANHLRIQKSYLSKILSGSAELTQDQLFLICELFRFNAQESRYLSLLLEYSSSQLKARRALVLDELERIRTAQRDTSQHLSSPPALAADNYMSYYLDPLHQILHVCFSIDKYAKNPEKLMPALGIDQGRLGSAIIALVQMGIIARGPEGIRILIQNVHLPRTSPQYPAWRNQLKLMAMQKLGNLGDENAYSFQGVFSASRSTQRKLQARLLEVIRELEQEVQDSPSEEVFQISLELFGWTGQ